MYSVYQHTSPSGKVYIGITKHKPEQRWAGGYKNNIYFTRAINKYGWENIEHKVLYTDITEEEAKSIEIQLIKKYKDLGISYNITDGGDGTTGHIVSEETRRKISEAQLGKKHSEETKQKISKALSKKVVQLNKDTLEVIKVWDSTIQVERELGIGCGHISAVCRGKRQTTGGFKWKYYEELS